MFIALQAPSFGQRVMSAAMLKLLDAASAADKEHAIVQKNYKRRKYFEFRMSGGADYEKRSGELNKLVKIYTGAMRRALETA